MVLHLSFSVNEIRFGQADIARAKSVPRDGCCLHITAHYCEEVRGVSKVCTSGLPKLPSRSERASR